MLQNNGGFARGGGGECVEDCQGLEVVAKAAVHDCLLEEQNGGEVKLVVQRQQRAIGNCWIGGVFHGFGRVEDGVASLRVVVGALVESESVLSIRILRWAAEQELRVLTSQRRTSVAAE